MDADILLVDSTPAVVEALGAYLEEKGYRVARFTDAAEALVFLREVHPPLAIVDSGFTNPGPGDFLSAAHADRFHGDVILLAAEDAVDRVAGLIHEGAFDYLVKPFDERALEKSVKAAFKVRERIDAKDKLLTQLLRKTERLETLVIEQEKRAVELEGAQSEATRAQTRSQSLEAEVDDLRRRLGDQDLTLRELRNERDDEREERGRHLAHLQESASTPAPSRLARLTSLVTLVIALGLTGLGMYGIWTVTVRGELLWSRLALMRDVVLLGLVFLGLTVVLRLVALVRSFGAAGTGETEEGRRVLERLLALAVKAFSGLSLVLVTAAGAQVWRSHAIGSNVDATTFMGGLVLTYLDSPIYREAVGLSLVAATASMLLATLAQTVLATIYYVRSISLSVQKNSAQKRLETL